MAGNHRPVNETAKGRRLGNLPPEKEEFVQEVERAYDRLNEPVDPLVEAVEDECPTCGAYMLNPALHRDWHNKYRQRISEIADEARRYKSPPTYGGR